MQMWIDPYISGSELPCVQFTSNFQLFDAATLSELACLSGTNYQYVHLAIEPSYKPM